MKNQTTTSQNGLYLVSAKSTTAFTLVKQTNPTNSYVVPVKFGKINKDKYFKYTSSTNTYSETDIQKKAIVYSKNGYIKRIEELNG